ncbi:MAG: nuclear transport factor 2 family protein [Actinomycetota bacterium]|nr:nuclear transport factor 2 family protein [Actinomycetota bacterium]
MADVGPWHVVQRINRAWQSGDADSLEEFFHPDVVVVHPRFEGRTAGRDACIESYREFAAATTVRRLDEFDPQIDVVGDTAIVTYGFRIQYEMGGEAMVDTGRDMFVLTRVAGDPWRAVWRTLVMEG